ncbi:hypothetical protein BJ875DRAFT_535403 [Amylocarpus encephaloides]|uniref:Mid2 domain-containing protein n=1 Tax=Amylocarpus encephaloides TaxID=45428 RepID=A0A9P7YGU3_9HELO|nr:hypothetical protein BJ875DRAFT_535403 [Amylocarpus encephaloides]
MRFLIHFELLRLASVVSSASGTVYITELPAYQSLVSCAASGVSYAVQRLTYSKCPTDPVALQSCACTKDSNSAAVGGSVAKQVQSYCDSTASEDVTSAASVFNLYCNPGLSTAAPTTKSGGVSQYITDLPEFTNLAPCAGSGISYAIQSLTRGLCPSDAPGLQSCACTKNQNSGVVTQGINSQVGYYCGSTHSEDKATAQAFFAGYCGLGNGSSVFPSISYLPGAVTYYVTDLPQYSSLAPCAASGLSYEMRSLTGSLCPPDPKALVSCACVKDNNSAEMTAGLMTEVKSYCGSTASDDVVSALSVFDFYCSAGKGLATPQGVTASVAAPGTGTKAAPGTGTNPTPGPGETGTSGSEASNDGSSGSSSSTTKKNKGGVPIAAIIGGAIGLVALLVIALIAFCCYRQKRLRKRQLAPRPPAAAVSNDYGKTELPNNEASTAHTASPLMGKLNPITVDHRPVSPMEEKPPNAYTTPHAGRVEMLAPASPYRAELQHQSPQPHTAEIYTSANGSHGGFPLQELPPAQQYQQPHQQQQAYQPVQQHGSPGISPHPSPAPFYDASGANTLGANPNTQPTNAQGVPLMGANNAGPVVYEMDARAWR